MKFKAIKYLFLIITSVSFYNQAFAAKINSNFSKTSLKTSETFTVTYSLINDKNRKLLATDPILVGKQISLKKYFLSDCSDSGAQVGEKLEPSVTASATYSIPESGLFYLKPEVNMAGYSGICTQISIFGADVPFEKLSASLTGISASGSNILVSWQDLTGNVSVNATQRATISLYSSSSCLGQRITGSRVSTLAPSKGESSASITIPTGVSSAFIQASSGTIISNCLSVSKITAPPASSGQSGPTTPSCPDGFVSYSGQCKQFIVACTIPNGKGSQAFNVSTGKYNQCIPSSCSTGYIINGNSCILQSVAQTLPSPSPTPVAQACTIADVANSSAVSGNKPNCSATACSDPSKYLLSNGSCSPIACSVSNSNIPNVATVSGTLVSGCSIVSCATGYDKSANGISCVLAPQACTVADVPNSSAVSGNKPSCSATVCIRNYTVQNGTCVVTGSPKIQAKVVSGGMYYKNTNGNFSIISTTGNTGALKKVSGSNFTIKTEIAN